jgi:hypothetical protein
MCSPSSPKPAPIVAPLSPAEQAKPLGVDDGAATGSSGIASLRTSGLSGFARRTTGLGGPASVAAPAAPASAPTVTIGTPARDTGEPSPRGNKRYSA